MAEEKSAPLNAGSANFASDKCKVKHKQRKVIIPVAAFDIIAYSTASNPFVQALSDISLGQTSNYDMDQFLQAAITATKRETDEYYAAKTRGGLARVDLAVKQYAPIVIPDLFVPASMKGYDRHTEYKNWSFTAKDIMILRYIMMARNYAFAEVARCLNEYIVKRPNRGEPISCIDEFWEKAQAWDNFGRASRFPQCPEFHPFCMTLMNKYSPQIRTHFLDSRLNASALAADGRKRILINCSHEISDLIHNAEKQYFIESVLANYPGSGAEFRTYDGFY